MEKKKWKKMNGKMKCRVFPRFACITIYVRKRENKKTIQTIHKTLHRLCILLIFRVLRCVQFVLQTIHKLYTNPTLRRSRPYIEAFKTLHSERTRNYTRSGTQTLHFVFEHESREWNLEREWSESYVTFVTNVTNVSNVTNVKQEMAIGGDALRHSFRLFLSLTLCLFLSPSASSSLLRAAPKIQQF